jgi:hypothetical protein
MPARARVVLGVAALVALLIDSQQPQQNDDHNDGQQDAHQVVRGSTATAKWSGIIATAAADQQNDATGCGFRWELPGAAMMV